MAATFSPTRNHFRRNMVYVQNKKLFARICAQKTVGKQLGLAFIVEQFKVGGRLGTKHTCIWS